MPLDIASLLFAMTVGMVTIAVALPAVMGRVDAPARRAQLGVALQALAWLLLLSSGLIEPGGTADRLLSTLAMAALTAGLGLNGAAFDLWCGRTASVLAPTLVTLALTIGYAWGFPHYAFRVGWANAWLTLQLGLVASTLWRRPVVPVGRWRWLMVLGLLAQMLVTSWRGVLGAFFTDSYPTFLAPHPANIVFALLGNSTTIVSVVAILLAHRDEAARDLERLATLDGLTGVYNRRAWLAKAQTQMAMGERYGHPMAVVMIDLDHFKQVNDSRGHDAGDQALRFVAQALRAAVRTGDLVGRYGGEEFCVLMSHADQAAAQAFDKRLRLAIADDAMRVLGFELDYSAGVALREATPDSLGAMLARADAALYDAKAQGRARTLQAQSTALELV